MWLQILSSLVHWVFLEQVGFGGTRALGGNLAQGREGGILVSTVHGFRSCRMEWSKAEKQEHKGWEGVPETTGEVGHPWPPVLEDTALECSQYAPLPSPRGSWQPAWWPEA